MTTPSSPSGREAGLQPYERGSKVGLVLLLLTLTGLVLGAFAVVAFWIRRLGASR